MYMIYFLLIGILFLFVIKVVYLSCCYISKVHVIITRVIFGKYLYHRVSIFNIDIPLLKNSNWVYDSYLHYHPTYNYLIFNKKYFLLLIYCTLYDADIIHVHWQLNKHVYNYSSDWFSHYYRYICIKYNYTIFPVFL